MIKKASGLFLVFIFISGFSFVEAYAQFDSDDTGGKSKCRFIGGTEKFKKKIKSVENSIIINEAEGTINYIVDAEFKSRKTETTFSLDSLVSDVDTEELVEAGIFSSISLGDDTFLSLDKVVGSKEVEVTNVTEDENGDSVEYPVTIKLTKLEDDLASGSFKITFPETNAETFLEDSDEGLEPASNGRVTINCKFTNVPVTFEVDEFSDDEFDDEFDEDEFDDEFFDEELF